MERNILLQNDKITIRENAGKRGIEVLFPMKPDEKTRQALKDAGFRWSRPQQLWWAYDNERTRRYIEEEISYRRDMKKLADWEEFRSEYANTAPKEELKQKSFFSPESYLATFREKAEKVFDNTSFNDYIVNSDIDNNRQIIKEEAAYESDEPNGSKGGQSDGPDGNERRTGSGDDTPEFEERNGSPVDGNPGGGYTRTGHETIFRSQTADGLILSLHQSTVPLPMDKFPKVLGKMSATKALQYIQAICKREGWSMEYPNIMAVLNNLDMEMA